VFYLAEDVLIMPGRRTTVMLPNRRETVWMPNHRRVLTFEDD
jgi:hypothetical protein